MWFPIMAFLAPFLCTRARHRVQELVVVRGQFGKDRGNRCVRIPPGGKMDSEDAQWGNERSFNRGARPAPREVVLGPSGC